MTVRSVLRAAEAAAGTASTRVAASVAATARRWAIGALLATGTRSSLQRDVAVLALRARLALGQQRLECGDDLRPGLRRRDDVVDVAALSRRVRVGEARLVVVDELLAALVGRRGLLQVATVDDVHRALRAHDGDLGLRPGEVEVGEHVLGAHDVVGAAVGLAGDDGDL